MGVPAVMVDEQGNRIPGIVPDAEILAHLDRHSKAVMQDILPHAGVLLRMPQGESAPAAQRAISGFARLPPMTSGRTRSFRSAIR